MIFLAQILLILLVPIQFLPLGIAINNRTQDFASTMQKSRVEGASTESANISERMQSVRGSLSEVQNQSEDITGSGFVPEQVTDFKPIKILAGASVVLDVDSGTILHYDSGRTHAAIASLTKVMTAVVVMENVKNIDEPVTIDAEALRADGTKVGCPSSVLCTTERLQLGEKVTVKNLLTAMLLDSANDAAIALGKYVAGSQQGFADMMNAKAKELNLNDSHFCNPSGLDIEGCYSSAYDLARIAAYSMKFDTIWNIMKMQEAQIESCDGKYTHELKNTDVLLEEIPNCLGGKTGFTYSAGKSLMLGGEDPVTNKHRIIAVILNDNNRWEDMKNLLDWTFASYKWI